VRRKLPLALPLAVLLGLAAAGLALAGNGGVAPPDPASPNAERVNDSYWFIAIFTGLIFLIVEGALIVFIVRFRRRGRPRAVEGPQIHGSTRLELIWTVAPVIFLAAIGSFLFYKLPGIKDVPAAGASERLNVTSHDRGPAILLAVRLPAERCRRGRPAARSGRPGGDPGRDRARVRRDP
jgi:heme/copper-type cytochrome/quinol oxidase subunit 2